MLTNRKPPGNAKALISMLSRTVTLIGTFKSELRVIASASFSTYFDSSLSSISGGINP